MKLFYQFQINSRESLLFISVEWNHFVFIAELLIGGYFLHYLPFFLTDSTLFLHSYLPCVIYKILAATALVDHLYVVSHR